MTWSLGEIESLARKAARGAGMDWGLAEEAGKAARWLCAAGWPGAEALAGLLTAQDGAAWAAVRPRIAGARWHAQGGLACPVAVGAALCDRAARLAAGAAVQIGPVAQPLLLVPFAVRAAAMTGVPFDIAWPGLRVGCHPDGTHAEIADPAALAPARAECVNVRPGDAPAGRPVALAHRGVLPDETARILASFAHRTYAPATPESRLSGAGAGLSDND